MEQKFRQYLDRAYRFSGRFRDVRYAGMTMFVVIVLLVSWSGLKAIQTNYGLQKQISVLRQQNQLQQLANNNLKLENQYYNTDTYLGLSARQNFGLAAPGEKEIVVPQAVALSYTTPLSKTVAQADKPSDKQPSSQRNFQSWVNFFLHRQAATNSTLRAL